MPILKALLPPAHWPGKLLRASLAGMRFGLVGCALVIASLVACEGQSDGYPVAAHDAGSGGFSVSSAGSLSGSGSSTAGASGSSSGGEREDAGAGASHAGASSGAASAGSPSFGGSTAGGGSSAQSGAGPSGGSSSGGKPGTTPWCPDSVCKGGVDQRLAPGDECPANRDCYADEWCGQSVQCIEYVEDGTCTEKPSCDPEQMTVPACLSWGICETRAACGKRILCETLQPDGTGCQPGLQKDRVFAAFAVECPTLSIHCPKGSSPFADECGCGCEQPEACPDSVNCQPGSGSQSELCTSTECPFTGRAL
ncbi:MAG TPA: hypothetical protein VJV79_30555 [Polyangiaceae bacterium]|nr:hypothetical protein [Polyangiaceae bacterium]